jgi:hypothetical protein
MIGEKTGDAKNYHVHCGVRIGMEDPMLKICMHNTAF